MNTAASHKRSVFTRPGRALLALAVATTAIAADVTTKYAVATSASLRHLPLVFRTHNADDLLGIVSGSPQLLSVTSLALIAAILVVFRARVLQTRTLVVATGLVTGGSFSNSTERLITGSVTDFLLVGNIVINIADLCVLVGVCIACASLCFGRVKVSSERNLSR
jgi:lipoprotein signal peptidase